MRMLVFVVALMSFGCPSAQPTVTVPADPPSSSVASTAPIASNAPPATTATPIASEVGTNDASVMHGPMGKPTSFGGGIPGECINCPPTGCPKSCESIFKGK
jgi:hypothetical protein